MKIGYIRVSTREQRTDRQLYGLKALCDRLYIEQLSAVAKKRPIFEKLMNTLKSGDTFVVWDIDRAFRNTEEALRFERQMREKNIRFVAMNLAVDTRTADGKYCFTMEAAAAERERMKISERTIEGLRIARAQGKRLGRRPKLSPSQLQAARKKLQDRDVKIKDIAAQYGVHPWTLSRNLK